MLKAFLRSTTSLHSTLSHLHGLNKPLPFSHNAECLVEAFQNTANWTSGEPPKRPFPYTPDWQVDLDKEAHALACSSIVCILDEAYGLTKEDIALGGSFQNGASEGTLLIQCRDDDVLPLHYEEISRKVYNFLDDFKTRFPEGNIQVRSGLGLTLAEVVYDLDSFIHAVLETIADAEYDGQESLSYIKSAYHVISRIETGMPSHKLN